MYVCGIESSDRSGCQLCRNTISRIWKILTCQHVGSNCDEAISGQLIGVDGNIEWEE